MKTRNEMTEAGRPVRAPGRNDRNGVALVLVLGLLSVLTLLAVAFAIAMRVERMAARNYANNVRAEHMIQVALVRSLEEINASCYTKCYPDWSTRAPSLVRDAMASVGSAESVSNLLVGEASNAIPGSLWAAATKAAGDCKWKPVANVSGDVAYLVVNCSGLLDANYVGGRGRSNYTEVQEIDLSSLPEMLNTNIFYTKRGENRRYETVAELARLNNTYGALKNPVSNLFVYSWDPQRDSIYTKLTDLGTRDIALTNKFNVNSITNTAAYYNSGMDAYAAPEFSSYYNQLLDILNGVNCLTTSAIPRVSDIVWNVINYLDTNRVPQTAGPGRFWPWCVTESTEDVPLVNEIVYQKHNNSDTQFEFVVEVWYPFYPNICKPSDGFGLQVLVFSNDVPTVGSANAGEAYTTFPGKAVPGLSIRAATNLYMSFYPQASAIEGVPGSQFKQFICVTSPVITAGSGAPPSLFVCARVTKTDPNAPNGYYLIDSAPGWPKYPLTNLSSLGAWSVVDPKSNGNWSRYWSAANQTLGTMNANCYAWNVRAQGVPIFFRDGPMETIGEVGHIYASNLDNVMPDPADHFFQSISILTYNYGAFLLDRMTTRDRNEPAHGLVSISSAQTNALLALFQNMTIGPDTDSSGNPVMHTLSTSTSTWPKVQAVVDAIIAKGPYWSFQQMFTTDPDGGNVGIAFRELAKAVAVDPNKVNEIIRQDPLRYIVEMITFRQNIFEIVLAARVRGKDGSVVAEKRALAVVYRDAFTSKHFLRSFKWLAD